MMMMMRGSGLRRVASRPQQRLIQAVDALRSFSTDAPAPAAGVLTREFIYGALYAAEDGYFNTPEREVLHAPTDPLPFANLLGERDYRSAVAKLYEVKREAWLTPVEVFAPYYSHAIAKYMLHSPFRPASDPLEIFEIGGGAGTNALHILNYLRVRTLCRSTAAARCLS